MVDSNEALARLRDPKDDGLAARLASLIVDDVLGRTLKEIVIPKEAAIALGDGIRAITASDAAEKRITSELERATRELAAEKSQIGAKVPAPLKEGLRELAQMKSEPHKEAILKLLDREPLRALLRAQVIDTLVAFGRKAASPVADSPIARGLGGLGKSMLGQIASRPSALGSLASAVSSEVERQVEKRATDFAETACDGIFEGVATRVSDPAQAKEQAAMRLALLDGLFELTGSDVADLTRANIGERVAVVRKAFAAWVATPTFESDVEAFVAKMIAKDGDRTLRSLLDDVALADTVATHARTVVRRRIDAIVATDAFASWLGALFA
jgi:hypothetical protein